MGRQFWSIQWWLRRWKESYVPQRPRVCTTSLRGHMRDLAAVAATHQHSSRSLWLHCIPLKPQIYIMQNSNIICIHQISSQLHFSQKLLDQIPLENPWKSIPPRLKKSPQRPRQVSVASSWRAATWRAASPWWISRARSIASCPGDDDDDIGLWVGGGMGWWDDGD